LVQNSFKHGLQKIKKDGLIQITIRDEQYYIHISVVDNGKGMNESRRSTLLSDKVESENGTGIGLYNLHQRLKKMIHRSDGLTIKSSDNGTEIYFFIPKDDEQGVKRTS
jgi:two-component system, LytTR family, sensor histidine kinase LytS